MLAILVWSARFGDDNLDLLDFLENDGGSQRALLLDDRYLIGKIVRNFGLGLCLI
jgi:hypothetical protein